MRGESRSLGLDVVDASGGDTVEKVSRLPGGYRVDESCGEPGGDRTDE